MTIEDQVQAPSDVPLCIDLDGTLVHTDTLVEAALVLLKRNILYLFAMFAWLFAGKARFKAQIAGRVDLNVAVLPYNQELLALLETHGRNRKLLLVTAAHESIARAVADHLGIFAETIASTETQNLSAANKCQALVERFGKGGFDYVGNSVDDLAVWSSCRRAIVVNARGPVARRAAGLADIEAQLPRQKSMLLELLRAMRPHQWIKNVLVFVHLLMAHVWSDGALFLNTLFAFFALCLCASSAYLVNDLLDLEADRNHSDKRSRPFASGQTPLLGGILLAPVLLVLGFILGSLAGKAFLTVLALYFLLTLAYSLYLKRILLIDTLVLATLYTLRIIAGAAVALTLPSFWLLSFSMFLFTSLAMVKRYVEIRSMDGDPDARVMGRGYRASDLTVIASLGVAAGYIAVLVLALYVNSPAVVRLYEDEQVIWLLCPLLLYWVGRIWVLASRGSLHQDPVVFASRDGVSYIVLALATAAMWVAL